MVHHFLRALLPTSKPLERVFFSVFNLSLGVYRLDSQRCCLGRELRDLLSGTFIPWKDSVESLSFYSWLSSISTSLYVLCPCFIRRLHRTACRNRRYFKSCFDLQSLFSKNINFPCSLFYFFFLNFKVSQNLGIGRNLECRVVWFIPLSSKQTGGQNLKLLYLDKEMTGQVSETVVVGPKGRLLLSGFDTSAHRVCMTNVGPVQGALLFFLTE